MPPYRPALVPIGKVLANTAFLVDRGTRERLLLSATLDLVDQLLEPDLAGQVVALPLGSGGRGGVVLETASRAAMEQLEVLRPLLEEALRRSNLDGGKALRVGCRLVSGRVERSPGARRSGVAAEGRPPRDPASGATAARHLEAASGVAAVIRADSVRLAFARWVASASEGRE